MLKKPPLMGLNMSYRDQKTVLKHGFLVLILLDSHLHVVGYLISAKGGTVGTGALKASSFRDMFTNQSLFLFS